LPGLAAALTAAIFFLDVKLPLEIAVCALYGVVVLLGLFVHVRGFSLWMAGTATLLTQLAAVLSPRDEITDHAVINRALTLVGIWVTAWLVSRYAGADRALDR